MVYYLKLRFNLWLVSITSRQGSIRQRLMALTSIWNVLTFQCARVDNYYYRFKLLNLLRQQQAYSKREFLKTTRGSAHLLLHSRNNSSRKEDAWTRNEVHWRITETPKRRVTSRDSYLGKEQKKSSEVTREERVQSSNLIKYTNNKPNMSILYMRWKK